LEIQTADGLFTIERALNGQRTQVYPSDLDNIDQISATTYVIEPTSDSQSLSQFLLATVNLQDVNLKEAPTQEESSTDRLSFRDLMWLCLFLNERIGSQQLLNSGNIQKAIKLRQVVDAVFGVHDNEEADLARRIRDAQSALDQQRRSLEQLQEFVAKQEPKSHARLEIEATELTGQLATVRHRLQELRVRESAASEFAAELRSHHAALSTAASRSSAKVRDRVSLLNRFGSLRAQYADDVRKLTLLVEAEGGFNQLSVEVCPACLNTLEVPPALENGRCTLCNHNVQSNHDSSAMFNADSKVSAQRELRAAKRRYRELDDFWLRLGEELDGLRSQADEDAHAEAEVGVRLDEATRSAVTPFLGERNELQAQQQNLLVRINEIGNGLRLRKGLEAKAVDVDRAEKNLGLLRQQRRDRQQRPDRESILHRLSERFRDILYEIEYPKIKEDGILPPHLDKNLVPYVRNEHFREASSGGQVLISLAWALAIFEVAYEGNDAHPGFLMIDTPQKNLGGAADDTEFADIRLVERFYRHIDSWLSAAGAGAQLIFVDNTPPDLAVKHIVIRYTRDPAVPPFGLIDNETGVGDDLVSAAEEADGDDFDVQPASEI